MICRILYLDWKIIFSGDYSTANSMVTNTTSQMPTGTPSVLLTTASIRQRFFALISQHTMYAATKTQWTHGQVVMLWSCRRSPEKTHTHSGMRKCWGSSTLTSFMWARLQPIDPCKMLNSFGYDGLVSFPIINLDSSQPTYQKSDLLNTQIRWHLASWMHRWWYKVVTWFQHSLMGRHHHCYRSPQLLPAHPMNMKTG